METMTYQVINIITESIELFETEEEANDFATDELNFYSKLHNNKYTTAHFIVQEISTANCNYCGDEMEEDMKFCSKSCSQADAND